MRQECLFPSFRVTGDFFVSATTTTTTTTTTSTLGLYKERIADWFIVFRVGCDDGASVRAATERRSHRTTASFRAVEARQATVPTSHDDVLNVLRRRHLTLFRAGYSRTAVQVKLHRRHDSEKGILSFEFSFLASRALSRSVLHHET